MQANTVLLPVTSTARLNLPRDISRREERAAGLATLAFFVGLALVLALPLFSKLPWLIFVQDDFLYYLKVAQNIAQGNGSTFNGLVATNGYQPLWLLVLVGLSWLTAKPALILAFLAVTDFVAALCTFRLASRLLRRSGVRPLLVFSLSAAVTLYSVTLFFYGMEVTLAVPIVLGVIALLLDVEWLLRSPVHTFLLGLLLSAMVLARIDTLILGGMILTGIAVSPALRRHIRPKLALSTLLGLLPVVAYFLVNRFFFHTWLPVSGAAKQLRSSHLPSIEPWRVFFHLLAASYAVLLITAFVLLRKLWARLDPMSRVLFPSVILFPFLYYLLLSCLSDWTLWGWYMYPLRTAVCVSFLIFSMYPPCRRLLEHPLCISVLVLLVFTGLGLLRWTRQQTDIYAASVEIRDFARSHPGVYAMGDRAGRVGYLLDAPVVQTEGLMMDRDYLDFVAAQRPLRETLAHYHARYYIATAYVPFDGCFHAAEPAKGGPASAKMRAIFCEPPAASFSHDGIETLIFDLQDGGR